VSDGTDGTDGTGGTGGADGPGVTTMASTGDGSEILHLPGEHRFVMRLDGVEAELVYALRGGRMILVHTGVPEELAGRGVGGLLVSAALRHATAESLVVAPWCPFARRYLRAHPEATAGVTLDWSEPPGATRPVQAPGPAGADGYLDEQEEESFPASDPHSDWAGPPP